MQWLWQTLLLGCILLLGTWVRLPVASVAGFGLAAVALLAAAAGGKKV